MCRENIFHSRKIGSIHIHDDIFDLLSFRRRETAQIGGDPIILASGKNIQDTAVKGIGKKSLKFFITDIASEFVNG